MGTCTSQFNMWTPLVAILLSVAFESSIARLPPPININQLDYAAGREAVPKMREEDIPLKCGAWKKMDCNDWENNYVMIETPGYPAKYQNKDQCTWTLRIPKESGTWIYCEEFRLNKGDYLFVGKQRYYGEKSWASIEPTQKSTKQNLKLRFKSNRRDTNNGFKCWVTCWPRDPSQTPAYTTLQLQQEKTTGQLQQQKRMTTIILDLVMEQLMTTIILDQVMEQQMTTIILDQVMEAMTTITLDQVMVAMTTIILDQVMEQQMTTIILDQVMEQQMTTITLDQVL